jgi:type I restriction-modification system DNA methylase subunit
LGLDKDSAVKVRAAKQLRPLVAGQPWGIFWIDFEPKKLPITVMRRILNQLVAKKRGGKSQQATWNLDDLLFISAVGSEKSDQREITFAHFHQEEGDLPTLRVLGWDGADTVLKIDYVAKTLKEKLLWPQNPKDVRAWREMWAEAFKHKPGHVIKTADALAARLAELARSIRAAAETIMKHETERGRLRKLHKAFQTALIHDLTEEDFADTYAQTITYGLLTAAISRTDMSGGSGGTALVAENVKDMVPVTNPFLREMLETFLHVGGRQGKGGIDFDELGIQDVVELLRSEETDLPAILRDFNNRAEGEDPVIRFYEDFLEAYDKQLKIQRGVFYTPKPVVSHIVRGVQELLQTEFGLEDGLASTITWGEMVKRNAEIKIPKGASPNSHFVMILDPATGTATFLVEVIDVIYKIMVARWKKQGYKDTQIQAAWNEYVPTSLLPRLYGYELMMAPYAIAHMKIGLKLFETGYRFASDQRANIYLTNALEEPSQLAQGSAASLFEALGHESQAVNDVKRRVHFTVVIGNPPYSGQSANASKNDDGSWNFIGKLLQDYYKADGKPLGERNPKWLQDDYVKFIRFGQWNIQRPQIGILAMITNHGYLDNPTFRGMRQQLLMNFEQVYLLDLHGNINKKETSPDGSKDENVFDIAQGVSICFLVKQSALNKKKIAHAMHANIFGLREYKYKSLLTHRIDLGLEIHPQSPFYLFIPQNIELEKEYVLGVSVADIFKSHSNGLVTARDSLTIHWNPSDVAKTVKDFSSLPVEKAREKYSLGDDTRDWKVNLAQKDIKASKVSSKCIVPVLYRPFDKRFTYYTGQTRGFICMPRYDIMRNLLDGKNLALITSRMTKGETFHHVQVTNTISEAIVMSPNTSNNGFVFPIYIYPETGLRQRSFFENAGNERTPNISEKFIVEVTKVLGLKFIPNAMGDLRKTFGAEDIFHYMYAVFHSPTYRSRYAEFLKLDFPRMPLTSNVTLFCQLCGLGKELVALHLLEASVLNKPIAKFKGKGDNVVAKGHPKYQDGVVLVNASQGFEGMPEDVWEFHIGGYQVCSKWLKDRRGRKLSAEDIAHYQKVVVALKETIRLMKEVDEVIESHGGWPIK